MSTSCLSVPLSVKDFKFRSGDHIEGNRVLVLALRSCEQLELLTPQVRTALRNSINSKLPEGSWLTDSPAEIDQNPRSLEVLRVAYTGAVGVGMLEHVMRRRITAVCPRPRHHSKMKRRNERRNGRPSAQTEG